MITWSEKNNNFNMQKEQINVINAIDFIQNARLQWRNYQCNSMTIVKNLANVSHTSKKQEKLREHKKKIKQK